MANNSTTTDNLIVKRNAQLTSFLKIICDLTSSLVHNAVTTCSTSFDMIIDILLDFHGLKRKPSIFDVSDVQYSGKEDFNTFYVKFRQGLTDK